MPRISILIGNYNYENYVGDAIQSALDLRCEDKEIIVVDDGSTDGSREVISSFADRLDKVIFTENHGQPAAANVAFANSTGEIVFFLDSDDMYLPQVVEKVLEVWRDGVSKVQFPLLNTDREGIPTGTIFPNYTHAATPQDVRKSLLETAAYQWAPTSGNAFSREFLEKIFPVPENLAAGVDSFLNPSAPLYGDVLTLLEPLVLYRVHGSNSWAQEDFDPERLLFYIDQELSRTNNYLVGQAAKVGADMRPDPLSNNVSHLMFRVGAKRMMPDRYPIPDESMLTLLRHAGPAIAHDESMSAIAKVLVADWFLAVAVLPRPAALKVMKLRFAASSRPEGFMKVMRRLRILREDPRPSLVTGSDES